MPSRNANEAQGASLRDRDARVIANIARLRFSPLTLIGGRGNRLIEEGGRQLLDLSASFGPAILGYSHPAITHAVAAACANMAGASLLVHPNENAVALAEDLLRLTPGRGTRRVWFGHSGSDANDCAVRVLQAATGRSRFVSFIGSYHGSLSGSMSISGHSAMVHSLPDCCCCPIRTHIARDSARTRFSNSWIIIFPPPARRTRSPPYSSSH